MILDRIGYSYNDLTIVPVETSYISSRSECSIFDKDGKLPIFTAPMTSVVSTSNYTIFSSNDIIPIIPRSVPIKERISLGKKGEWIAVSLKEFKDTFITTTQKAKFKVCIDIANGHMNNLIALCKEAKDKVPEGYNLTIMLGNIANPQTFHLFSINNARNDEKIIDYVRCGIGAGAGCITSSNTGVHYPMASLINDCCRLKTPYSPKIIADGGIRNYSDVIKALALGADYVMIGSLFAQCEESAGEKIEVSTGECCVNFYGMASAEGQIAINGEKTKTAEGISVLLPVKYKLGKWSQNMKHYLRSAMSYCNAYTLLDFIGKQNLIINTINAVSSVNK